MSDKLMTPRNTLAFIFTGDFNDEGLTLDPVLVDRVEQVMNMIAHNRMVAGIEVPPMVNDHQLRPPPSFNDRFNNLN